MHHFFIALVLFFFSCSSGKVTVYNQTLNEKFLASAHVKTPDPRQIPFEGQRLVVRTQMTQHEFKGHTYIAKVYVQFGNRTQKVYSFELKKPSTDHMITLIGQEYQKKKGIATYKVELYKDGVLEEVFEHQLWCELIDMSEVH
jgi:hypothetical protein